MRRLHSAEDWDCVLRLILGGSSAGLVDAPLAVYRIHDGSLTGSPLQTLRDRVRLLEKASANPDLRPQERPALERSLAVQRRRARLAAAQAAVAADEPDARRRCLDWRSPAGRFGPGPALGLGGRFAPGPAQAVDQPRARGSPPSSLEAFPRLRRAPPAEQEACQPGRFVVMPVRNGETLPAGCDRQRPRRTAFEISSWSCVDDGSTDSTPSILAEYAAQDPRVRVYREEGDNLATVLNRGFRVCHAPLFARLDADDVSCAAACRRRSSSCRATRRWSSSEARPC